MLKSIFSRILPIDFYQIGDRIIRWIRKKEDINTAIVDINFTNLGGHLYRVGCNITYRENEQLKRSIGIVTTTISNEDTPDYISQNIEDNSLNIIKLNEEDLDLLNNELDYNLEFKLNWNNLIIELQDNNISFINLKDRVFYTLIEYFNANKEIINCKRVGIIEKLPIEVSTQLYPFKECLYELKNNLI